jgi:hypothetical protein
MFPCCGPYPSFISGIGDVDGSLLPSTFTALGPSFYIRAEMRRASQSIPRNSLAPGVTTFKTQLPIKRLVEAVKIREAAL